MDSTCQVQQGYGEFSHELHALAAQRRIPISGSLEVTLRCNLRCQHCYIPLDLRGGPSLPELSLAEIRRILNELAEVGCLWLLLTGGEPLMRRDFLDIYDYARQKGFLITLFTNGTLVTPAIADHLAQWRPYSIKVSLYGATSQTYERVSGVPGSLQRCLQGIRLLHERRLPLKLKTMVMSLNQGELAEMHRFADQMGVEFRFDPMIKPGLDGAQQPTSLRLAPAEIVDLERGDPYRTAQWPAYYQNDNAQQSASRKLYLCSAGKNSFHIDAFGRLSLCLSARQPCFDLRQGSFRQGWDEFLGPLVQQEYSAGYACGGCELRPVCTQCPALNYLETGSREERVPFICQVAHLRQKIFSQVIT